MWYKTQQNKFPEEDTININAGFVIGASIINWIGYAAYINNYSIPITSGFYEGDLHLPGLIWAIAPPLLIAITAYLLFRLIYHISFEIFIAKQRNKKEEKK